MNKIIKDLKTRKIIDGILKGFLKTSNIKNQENTYVNREKLINDFVNKTIELEYSSHFLEKSLIELENKKNYKQWYDRQNKYSNKLLSKYGDSIHDDLFELENAISILYELKMEYAFKQGVKEGLNRLNFLSPLSNFDIEINSYSNEINDI